jgi:hypothetical protein
MSETPEPRYCAPGDGVEGGYINMVQQLHKQLAEAKSGGIVVVTSRQIPRNRLFFGCDAADPHDTIHIFDYPQRIE